MKNIKITQEKEDNSFWINYNGYIRIGLSWNNDKQHWVTFSIDRPDFSNLYFGDGPLPDWTSLIQFLLEYND